MSGQPFIQRKLYDFVDVLRDADVQVSADEILSLFTAVQHVPILDRRAFRQALKTTLIKDYTDIPVFDRCFAEFFENMKIIEAEIESATSRPEGATGQRVPPENAADLENAVSEFLDNLAENLMFQKTPEELLSLLMDQMQQRGSSGGAGMMIFNARSTVIQSYDSTAMAEDRVEADDAELRERLLSLMREQLQRRRIGTDIRRREEFLLHKPIYRITPEEIKEMRELIRRFGQKLKNRISLRKKRVKHGNIDIKRTLRDSLHYGGIPFKIYRKDKKIDRPQLVVMCDISGSVNQYSRFMLLLTYTLQGLFSKVRTFAFISNMVEITPLFMEMDPERALSSIFQDTNFTYGWGSNYGRCFQQFISNYSDSLTGKTTVLVLGDGRNNYQDPGLDSFVRIKERSRNLFWLNPDRRHLWAWSDSLASLYESYCNEMREVNNFLDLSEFIDKLFRH